MYFWRLRKENQDRVPSKLIGKLNWPCVRYRNRISDSIDLVFLILTFSYLRHKKFNSEYVILIYYKRLKMVCLPYCKSIFKASASNMRIPSAKKKNRVIWPVLCYICNLKIRQARALFSTYFEWNKHRSFSAYYIRKWLYKILSVLFSLCFKVWQSYLIRST